jgi:hypothetical protein
MYSYAGIFEGEFCSYYYCDTCWRLHNLLGWDWTEGIPDAEEALEACGVIAAIRCPYYEMAVKDMNEKENAYYEECAQNGETEIAEYCGDGHCDNKPEEQCSDWSIDFVTCKISFTCDCMNGERREWDVDLMEAAIAFVGMENE